MNEIEKIVDRFYMATGLSISTVNKDNEVIFSRGLNKLTWDIFYDLKPFNKSYTYYSHGEGIYSMVLKDYEKTYISSIPLNSRNLNDGFFLLGPHTCINNTSFTYRPRKIIPYLASLLHLIRKDVFSEGTADKYNFHVKKSLNYIDLNYRDNISLTSVANYLNINKSYFSALFKRETGKTFSQVLNEIRVEKSKFFLVNTNMSMLEIALSCGFNNQNYFNISFKKVLGMSPMEFKNNIG